ncbi:uncharacterized protein KY384_006330 [Bacidia gigantensis]|uniref:uncharacterized protein n=1 Tax=Bacidia gigantensis TaxID=2732470 RepID=UPI001D05556A|nr:uncharacterized protein KY384_006330 [Bacidia gigantensis]KAG8528643.1 hypothetical protein KY384_006330 [Bacidia gigantensis]
MATSDWAVKELEKLLPLDHDSLIQILEYTSSLSKSDSAEHLKNLLGDTPKALEFISSYNARRQDTASSVTSNAAAQTEQRQDIDQSVPKSTRKGQKKKHPLHALPSRQIEGQGNVTGGYKKGSGDDYISSNKPRRDPEHDAEQASTFALSSTPDARQLPKKTLGKLPLQQQARSSRICQT